MVDFSCALKLAMPISVLSAIREANEHRITVKGGKFLEALAEADTIVFDKTGTLTEVKPVVSAADVGIAVSDGAEIAREIADIMIGANDLYGLVKLKKLSNALVGRIHGNYRVIVGFNTALILLGVGGFLQPASSALLHNTSTLAISLKSMQDLL